jgi:hypothetical protein
MRIPNGEFVSYGYDGITVTAEILEVLEDTYISFTDWGKNEKRLFRMKTVNNLGEGDVAGEFYWMLPVDCFTDFTEYKYIVFRSAYQISIENSVWYNITLGCAERFDLPIYTSFEREEPDCEWVMAFGVDGLLDNSLWYINDKLTEYTNYSLEYWKSKDYDKYVKDFPIISSKSHVFNSDAHNLWSISEAENFIELEDEPYSSDFVRHQLFKALRGKK